MAKGDELIQKGNNDSQLSEAQKADLDKRVARYERGEGKSYSWQEVEARVRARYLEMKSTR